MEKGISGLRRTAIPDYSVAIQFAPACGREPLVVGDQEKGNKKRLTNV
jgi:hypothetical protein